MSDEGDFAAATALTPRGAGRHDATVPDGWQQGRGAYGGLVLGVLARAMEAEAEADRPLRALNGEIPSPVEVGPAEIAVTCHRRGKAVSSYQATLVQGGETRARASAIFGAARPVSLDGAWAEPPAPQDWAALPVAPVGPPMAPVFAAHFEFRPTAGLPFTGAEAPAVDGWVRPVAPLPRWGAPELVGLVDTYWPALFPTLSAPRPMATVAFGLHLTDVAHRLEPGPPLRFRSRGVHVGAGFAFEVRELWSAAGELLAVNPQTFAIIK